MHGIKNDVRKNTIHCTNDEESYPEDWIILQTGSRFFFHLLKAIEWKLEVLTEKVKGSLFLAVTLCVDLISE